MKGLFIAASIFALSGCGLTPQGDMFRSEFAARSAVATDSALENTLFAFCRAIPVGALQRWFAGSKERADAWWTVCSQDAMTQPIPPLPIAE